jgi:DNA/RNA endonuclease YhcR with UshA esterase domain
MGAPSESQSLPPASPKDPPNEQLGPPNEQLGPPADGVGTPGKCPSCGHFVGPYVRCPYCGADVGQRLAVRTLKYGSLLLAVAGLAVLLLVAAGSEVPAVQVGNLAATMNWAYVRVEGLVSRQPAYDPAADLTFWVWDGTGEIMVVAYGAEAEELLAQDPLPVMGDGVSLAGTLRIKEDFAYLVLNDPEQMEVRPAEPLVKRIAELHAGLRYQAVRLRGVIREERVPYEGLHIASLWDDSGSVDLILPAMAAATGDGLPLPAVGQAVEVVGAVDLYRDTVQVSIGRPGDLVVLDDELLIAPLRDIGSLSAADVGRLAAVEGRIADVNPFSAGVKWTLADDSGAVTLLLWQDFYDSLPDSSLPGPGAAVRAQGLVAEYRGELEIVPELAADIVVLTQADQPPVPSAAPQGAIIVTPETTRASSPHPTSATTSSLSPSPTPPPTPQAGPHPSPSPPPTPGIETRSITAITPADVGRTLSIERAGIAGMEYLSKGVKLTLTDSTGSIALLLWQDVLEETADRHDLLPGSQVKVTGRIDEYEGELEIVPHTGDGVTVLSRGERLPVEERQLAQIGASDQGRVFTVEGTLTRVEGRGWLHLWLGDDTGEMLIFAPERVVSYLPPGLGPGTRLRVTGQVEIYQGTLEIIPLAGADVEVQ